ncbi:MAG: hypothetical protein HRF48_15310 [Chloroflexota bacterium]|jgi:hypothetical protein
MRFDNGLPWGTASPVPSALALWLAGLGIQPIFGRPARSTDNAVVERAHGVLNGWVEPAQCATFEQLCAQLARFTLLQREQYPVKEGRSRLQCYPELTQVVRPYDPAQDAHLWSQQAMFDYLATWRFQRKVELNGRITLLNREYSVGRDYKRRTLTIQLDATTHEWVVSEEDGREIRRFVPKGLDYSTIFHMTLAFRRRGKTQ